MKTNLNALFVFTGLASTVRSAPYPGLMQRADAQNGPGFNCTASDIRVRTEPMFSVMLKGLNDQQKNASGNALADKLRAVGCTVNDWQLNNDSSSASFGSNVDPNECVPQAVAETGGPAQTTCAVEPLGEGFFANSKL